MQRQVPCPNCGGEGHMVISLDMAIDAGDRSMAGHPWGCSHCNGDGWIMEEARAVAPVETPLTSAKEFYSEWTKKKFPLQPLTLPTVYEWLEFAEAFRDKSEAGLRFQLAAEQTSWHEGYDRDQATITGLREEIERLRAQKVGCPSCGCAFTVEGEDLHRGEKAAALLYRMLDAEKLVTELRAWKESQMAVTPDWQKIGELLNIGLGQSVTENIIPAITELRAKLAEQEKERDLYALLRGICEEVIDWLATLSYDGIWETKNVLDHPLTKDIRLKLQQMYDHPLDNKLLIRTDVLEAKLERAEAAEAELAALRERERETLENRVK